MSLSVHFMSQSVDWATPEWLYKELDQEFQFDFDPCPLYGFRDGRSGLEMQWGKSTYCNPPYGRVIGAWTAKAVKEAGGGTQLFSLSPAEPTRSGGIETL